MPSDRLTPLDASFLHMESESTPMHVGCTLVFAGDAPSYDEFVDGVESRLHLVPRYRQRLAFVPLAQGRPKWTDDTEFDIRYHVRVTALPRPGEDEQLRVLSGRLFSQPLNRDKPLWEMWLVEGLDDGRFAIISKTHHALVDGVSGMDVIAAIFAPDEDARPQERWQPRTAPPGIVRLGEALFERATQPAEILRPARAFLRRPQRVLSDIGGTLVGMGALAWAGLRPAPSTPYNRTRVSGDRRVAWMTVSLDDVKEIKNALGGTVNDVILAVVARALRRDLQRRGEQVDGLNLQTFVPISIQEHTSAAQPGNEVTGMVVPLPVSCPDPIDCLTGIRDSTRAMKESGQAMGAQALTGLGGLAPPTILDVAMRLAARQRLINLVVTNVPGPQEPLFMGDAELLEILPMVPLGANLALNVAIISYNGRVSFGIMGDFHAVPEVETIAEDVRAGLEELAEVAGVELAEAVPGPGAEDEEPAPAVYAVPLEEPAPAPPQAADDEDELVASAADPGAEEGAGPELHVDEPWPNYAYMTAEEVADRLRVSSEEEVAVVRLYESAHRRRRDVLRATEEALSR